MNSEKNVLSIQALRGIAAILVVFCHSIQYVAVFSSVHMERYLGSCFGGFGVDIFFVISGFIMVYIYGKNFGNQSALFSFITKRAIRIFPMYWVVLLVVLTIIIPTGLYADVMLQKQQDVLPALNSIKYIFCNVLLIPPNGVSPIVAVAWTLFFEMFFYYVFGVLLIFNKNTYLPALSFIFVSLVLLNFAALDFHINKFFPFINFFGNDIILEFIFGCFIAEQYMAGKLLTNTVAILVVILSILMLFLTYHGTFIPVSSSIKAFQFGIPSAGIVFGLVSLEFNKALQIPQFLIYLGDCSYSLYLTHLSIFLVILIAIFKEINFFLHIPGDALVIIAWLTCIFLGCLTFNYVEKPLVKWCKKHITDVSFYKVRSNQIYLG